MYLKCFFYFETDYFLARWVYKLDMSSMEVHSFRRCTIKIISNNWGIQPELMSGVHTQLMRSSGKWPKIDLGHRFISFNDFPLRNAFFPGCETNQLPGTVQQIST